ncbi:MAG: hypothetical protein ABI867_07325 [Kofleriaceae bacterium]
MLRFVILVGLVLLPTGVLAKPTVAVAPIGGDSDETVADAVVEALGDSAKVVKPKETIKAIGKLGIAGELDAKDAARVQKKLDVDVVVQGHVKRDGKNKKLKLLVFAKGKKPSTITLLYKLATGDKFKETLRDELAKRLPRSTADDEEEDTRKKKKLADDEEDDRKKKQKLADDEEEGRKKKKLADDEEEGRKKKKQKKQTRVSTVDDDELKVRKKKRRKARDDDEDEGRLSAKESAERAGRVMLRLDAGGSFTVRRLTYKGGATPPRLGTGSMGAHVEGELYPFANDPKSATSGLGIAGSFDKTFGLTIEVPAGPKVPINKQFFSIGGRYRFGLGEATTVAFGLDLEKSKYIADRSGLAAPTDLDAPDTNYTVLAPGIALRTPVGASAAVFAGFRGMIVLGTGPIQQPENFGGAKVYGIGAEGGTDIAISSSLALRIAGELTQISYKFNGNGAITMVRGITAATDRSFGLAATLAMKY